MRDGVQRGRAYRPAVGALIGAAGHGFSLDSCGVYIDKSDKYYEESNYDKYRVFGWGAVGGLIGYAKSHNTATGSLDNDASKLALANCFAAIPVLGDVGPVGDSKGSVGYTSGMGGLIGVSILTNFYNCYASGNVTYVDMYNAGGPRIDKNEKDGSRDPMLNSVGIGGFVGTSHGTKYGNCFATGAVTGDSKNDTWYAVGGFVGSGIYNECFSYSDGRIEQQSLFENCYSIGAVKVGNNTNTQFFGYISCNVSLQKNDQATRKPETWKYDENNPTKRYLYRNSYFLYQTEHTHDPGKWYTMEQDRTCADQCTFVELLPEDGGHFYGVSGWEAATMATSHPYRTNGDVYPFSKLVGMDYYGDWPTPMPSVAIAYYEKYKGDTVTRYFFNESDVTTKNDKKYIIKNEAPYEEGYSLLVLSTNDWLGNIFNDFDIATSIKVNDQTLKEFFKERLKLD